MIFTYKLELNSFTQCTMSCMTKRYTLRANLMKLVKFCVKNESNRIAMSSKNFIQCLMNVLLIQKCINKKKGFIKMNAVI